MARGSGTSFQNPFDEKEKKNQNQGPSIGSTRNHPTRKGIKQKYTSKGWTNIRGDGSGKSTSSNKPQLSTPERVRRGRTLNNQRRQLSKAETELARLKGGGGHRPWWKVTTKGPDTEFHKGRIRQLEKQVNSLKSKTGTKTGMQDDQGDKGKGPASNRVGSTPDKKTWPTGSSKSDKSQGGNVTGHWDGKNFVVQSRGKNKESGNQGTTETAKSDKKQETKPADPTPTTVFTKHYKTGKALGVMTRAQRTAYEKEAGNRTWESEVAKHHKDKKTPKHLKETKYKASLRKKIKATKRPDEDETKGTGSIFVRSKIT